MCFCLLPVTGLNSKFSFAETSSRFVILDNFTRFWTILFQKKCCSCGFGYIQQILTKFCQKISVVILIFRHF